EHAVAGGNVYAIGRGAVDRAGPAPDSAVRALARLRACDLHAVVLPGAAGDAIPDEMHCQVAALRVENLLLAGTEVDRGQAALVVADVGKAVRHREQVGRAIRRR